jgi:hypothetical protein
MTVRTCVIIGSVWFAAVCFAGEARAQTYVWQRTEETVTAHSKAHWTLQGMKEDAEDPSTGPNIKLDGFATSELTGVGATRPAFAGSGGGGGDGGANGVDGANGADGASGTAAPPMDGDPGASPLGHGGAGGKAGADGEATADINTNGIVEVNPDGQAVLSWS